MTSRPATGLPPGLRGVGPSGSPVSDTAVSDTPVSDTPVSDTTVSDTDSESIDQPNNVVTEAGPTGIRVDAPAPLAADDPAERHRLPPRVTRYWRWRIFFSAVPLLLLLISLAIVIPWGAWWMRWGVVGISFAIVVLGMILAPPIRYRVFWYAISPTEIDIQHGIVFIKRSVVPMHRVQNLRTERGPMADHYQMTNLKIRTAAGSVNLSGLDRVEANDLCDRISKLSDVTDDV